MQVKTPTLSHHFLPITICRPVTHTRTSIFVNRPPYFSPQALRCSSFPPSKEIKLFGPKIHPSTRLISKCIGSSHELVGDGGEFTGENGSEKEVGIEKGEELANQSIWNQMKEILLFTGPASGLWICGPLMSLIDTAVIGQGSSIELAALGPGTVFCDNISYIFMFLSISTSNMVATSLAKEDKVAVQHQVSVLLFIALAIGAMMFLFTKFCGLQALTAFTGARNSQILSAANIYVQIRALAWPAIFVGWVTQSASLGMKDSWGPLKALAAASAINGFGDIFLCRVLDYGIAGAAWATMASQVVAAFMMIDSLNKKGYNAFAVSVPSKNDLVEIVGLALPVFIMLITKVSFYSLIIYFATSMGTIPLAAHQVMIQTFVMCAVWGEPLSQTAQSFMPEFLYGIKRNLAKARMLLKSLFIIGIILGLFFAVVGTSVPWLFPTMFTPDQAIIQEMHKVLVPYFISLAVTPCLLSLEGALLAGRDFKFIGVSMSACFALGAVGLMFLSNFGFGLPGCWWALVGLEWARFSLAFHRLLSPTGILFNEVTTQHQQEKLKAA